MRTIVEIPEDQIHDLRELCERKGISRAEAIRRAIKVLLERESKERRKDALEAAFGSWPEMNEDSVEYVRRLRSEWDERESSLR